MLKTILVSSRPLSWVNTAFPFLIAYYGVTQRIDLPLIIGTIYFLIPYNIAMYGINDVYDYESDLRNPRKGGVEGAVLDRALHRPALWAVVVSNVPFLPIQSLGLQPGWRFRQQNWPWRHHTVREDQSCSCLRVFRLRASSGKRLWSR